MVFNCSICSESLENSPATNPGDDPSAESNGAAKLSATACGHIFHTFCIRKWICGTRPTNDTCPCCRKRATRRSLHPLFPDSYDDSAQAGPSSVDVEAASNYAKKTAEYEKEINALKTQVETQKEEINNNNMLYQMQCDEFLKMKDKYEKEQDKSETFLLMWKKHESYKEENESVSKICKELEKENEKYKYIQSQLDLVKSDIEKDIQHFAKFNDKEDAIRLLVGIKNYLQKKLADMAKKSEEERFENGVLNTQDNQIKEEENEIIGVIDKLKCEKKNLLETQQLLEMQLAEKSQTCNCQSDSPNSSGTTTVTFPESPPNEIGNDKNTTDMFGEFVTPLNEPKPPSKRLYQTICISGDDEDQSKIPAHHDIRQMIGNVSTTSPSVNIESLVNENTIKKAKHQ